MLLPGGAECITRAGGAGRAGRVGTWDPASAGFDAADHFGIVIFTSVVTWNRRNFEYEAVHST